MKKDKFFDIPKYPGYKVNLNGEVLGKHGKILNEVTHENGYKQVNICMNGKETVAKVHRLLAMAFIPNPKNKPHINHKNGIKDDNCVHNLEWCTREENMAHALKNGLVKTKLTANGVLQIRSIYEQGWFKQYEIAEAYSVGQQTISSIVRMRTWKILANTNKAQKIAE